MSLEFALAISYAFLLLCKQSLRIFSTCRLSIQWHLLARVDIPDALL